MFVTTAGRTNQLMIEEAMNVAKELNIAYIPRRKKSILQLQGETGSGCLVVGKERLELFGRGEESPFFFHPNSAMFRIKRIISGEEDPFLQAANLQAGDNFLDCTLGLASDSIIASFIVGQEGYAAGVEGNKYLAYIVKRGLAAWRSGIGAMDEAMQRISVHNENSYEYLKMLPDQSVDIIYFDPMFDETITESDGIKALGQFAIKGGTGEQAIREALRAARKRVVLKDHYKSHRFEQFGFKVNRRKTAKFHFGYIEIGKHNL